MDSGPRLSIIIPTFNEEKIIRRTLTELQPLRARRHQIIVVDGGSSDRTAQSARPLCDRFIQTGQGRALQMRLGAQLAIGDIFLFLHADSRLPGETDRLFRGWTYRDDLWGRFDIRLSGHHFMFRIIEYLINLRSGLSGIATGDQCLFVSRSLYRKSGGFSDLALMEDVAFSKTLLRYSRPICLASRVTSSSRRWEREGIIYTILKMWLLRGLYALGVDPGFLAKLYGSTTG